MTTLEQQIIDIVFATIPLEVEKEEVNAETTMNELGISSLETVTLIFEFEETFNIYIDTEEMFALKSLSDVAGFIEQKVLANAVARPKEGMA